jgi:hypothetical protein
VDAGRVARESGIGQGKLRSASLRECFPLLNWLFPIAIPGRHKKAGATPKENRRTGTGMRIVAALGGN